MTIDLRPRAAAPPSAPLLAALLVVAAAVAPAAATAAPPAGAPASPAARPGPRDRGGPFDLVLRGGRIVDGAGNPWYEADLAIRGDRIAAIGRLEGAAARRSIDVRGLVVAPGFIDMLGQSEYTVLVEPRLPGKTLQGITTEVTGEGGSVGPMTAYSAKQVVPGLADWGIVVDWTDHASYFRRVEKKGTAVNFAHLVGAAQVREAVLEGANRAPSPDELEKMKTLVDRAMEQGAWGLSSSLIYPPGTFAATDELVELAKVAARHGGIYATHIRNEAERLLEALDEAAAIAERAGIAVEIWHLKAAGRANWGRLRDAVRAIESHRARGLDLTADIYPYPASMTGLAAGLPPTAAEGGLESLLRRLRDPAERDRIRAEIENPTLGHENLYRGAGGAEGVLIAGVRGEANRKYQGKRLSEVAALRGVDPITAMFDLLVEENGVVDTVYFSMSEDDVRLALAQPWVSFNCDAPGVTPDGLLGRSMTHPRAYGSFPRILGRYVRDERLLRLEEAIRKMTSLPAQRLGLRDRGLLRPGMHADVTVFDPAAVIDRATFEDPHRYSEGIVHVFVNGVPVVDGGRPTDRLPGRILRGPGWRPGR
jgi:dihydroorotase/N-acyl-D-amino-acid deacylase